MEKTLNRKQYLSAIKQTAKEINSSKDKAIEFYSSIGILTPTGRVAKNYKSTTAHKSSQTRKVAKK